jgi:alginate O-acetyltransferase complex protein AlgI
MLGAVLIVHFGVFHLLSLIWRARGINAQPIMRSPVTATALSRFWSGAWNAAFSDFMHERCLKPLARHVAPQIACMVVFALSGVLHELVISLPARGGYGLPTVYFLVQGLGVLVERNPLARKLGFGAGWKGRVFVACVAGFPALWLFHPKFIHVVILPMLSSIGAT